MKFTRIAIVLGLVALTAAPLYSRLPSSLFTVTVARAQEVAAPSIAVPGGKMVFVPDAPPIASTTAPQSVTATPVPTTAPPVQVVKPAAGFFDKPLIIDTSRVDGQPQIVKTESIGTWAGTIIEWIAAAAAGPIAALIVAVIYKAFQLVGIKMSNDLRVRLEDITRNGVALAAEKSAQKLDGTMNVEVKGQIANDALQYVKDHAKETLKGLGLNPNDPKAEEAILARVSQALQDKINPPTAVTVTAPASSTVAADISPAPAAPIDPALKSV